MADWYQGYLTWLRKRPMKVQSLAWEFPPGSQVQIASGLRMHIVGYSEENDGTVLLLVSPDDPMEDYDLAVANRETLCPSHIRSGQIKVLELTKLPKEG